MDRRWFSIAALPALLLAAPALASVGAQAPAASELPVISPLSLGLSETAVAPAVAEGQSSEVLAAAFSPVLESIRYRPRQRWRERDRDRDRDRSYARRSSSNASGFSQIHGGFFDPDGEPPSALLLGVRAGANLDDKFQLGLGLDWSRRADRAVAVVTEVPVPGGGVAEQQRVLARSSSNLIPMTAFLQVTPGSDLPLSPYFGVAGGYEVLFLDAEDFETGEQFEATYGGWGWQIWGGATAQLSGQTRLAAEVFWNDAVLERDLDDPGTGQTLREIVMADGLGMRIGLNWGF